MNPGQVRVSFFSIYFWLLADIFNSLIKKELDLKLLAMKGIGKDHAKFSPVATAFYKLQNEITLKRDFYDDEAERLAECFSPGVIGIVVDTQSRRKKAVVVDARRDTCSRQIYMHEELARDVELKKQRDHFICELNFFFPLIVNYKNKRKLFSMFHISVSVESTGALASHELVKEAIQILINKTEVYLKELNAQV